MESVGNSTIQILDASSSTTTFGYYTNIFDGTPQDTENYGTAHIIVSSNQPGIINAMHSMDREYWDITDSFSYPFVNEDVSGQLGQAVYFDVATKAKWYKTQFINSADISCNLRLQTLLHPDSQPLPDPLNINLQEQEIPYVTVSGTVTLSEPPKIDISSFEVSINAIPDPISKVWESDELVDLVQVESSKVSLFTIHGMNFAPDYRFIKLYNTNGPIPDSMKPKMTIPIVPDTPQNMQFPNGLVFDQGLQIKATRCINFRDSNYGESGDVHIIITYNV